MSRITDIHLERYLAGLLSAAEAQQLEARIKADSELSSRVEILRRSNEEFLAEASPDVFARRLQGRLEMQEQETGLAGSWLDGLQRVSLAFAVLFVCGAVYWFTESAGPMGTPTLSQSVESSMPARMTIPAATVPGAEEDEIAPPSDSEPAARPLTKEANKPTPGKSLNQKPSSAVPRKTVRPEAASRRSARSGTSSKRTAREAAPGLQAQLGADTPQAKSRPQARRAPPSPAPRMFVRKFAPKPVQLRLKGPKGDLRVPGKPITLGPGDALVVSAVPGSRFHWSYALVGKTGNGASLGPTQPSLYDGSAASIDIRAMEGPTDVWVFYSEKFFSTEEIIFDGLSYQSQDAKIQILQFSAIF